MKSVKVLILTTLVFLLTMNCSDQENPIPECNMLSLFQDSSVRLENKSLKGEFLFSWKEDNFWHYSIVPNLNITPASENISDDNTLVGEECLMQNLSLLAEEEEVFWVQSRQLSTVEGENISLEYPPKYILNEIINYCKGVNIELILDE